jgi:hypothetical protein
VGDEKSVHALQWEESATGCRAVSAVAAYSIATSSAVLPAMLGNRAHTKQSVQLALSEKRARAIRGVVTGAGVCRQAASEKNAISVRALWV